MSIEEVAEKMKKDSETIKSWGNGNALPSLAQLEKLAYVVFKIPLAVFFMPEPPIEPPINQQFRTIPEKEIAQLPSSYMILVRKGQYYQEVLRELFNGKNPSPNPVFKRFIRITEDNIQNTANELRRIFNINKSIQEKFKNSTNAFKYYRNQVEENGIFVFQQTLKNFCRGYSLFDNEFPIIVVNSSEISDTGKNFTLSHELSHLLFETGGITNEFFAQTQNKVEILCNKLASFILVDDQELLENEKITSTTIKDWNEDLLIILAREHKVSKEVILRKLLDLNLTTQSYYSQKRKEWLASLPLKKKGGGGDFYMNKLSKLGYNFSTIVLNNLYSGRISPYQASEYLGIKINQIPQIERLVYK